MCTWFKHDSLARQDKKVRKLLSEYGWAGYGVFFAILELMAYDKGHHLEYNLKELAYTLGLRSKREREMLRYIVDDSGLFVRGRWQGGSMEHSTTDGVEEFYSPRMVETLAEVDSLKVHKAEVVQSKPRVTSAKQKAHLERARTSRGQNRRASNQETQIVNTTKIENEIENEIEVNTTKIESKIENEIEVNTTKIENEIENEIEVNTTKIENEIETANRDEIENRTKIKSKIEDEIETSSSILRGTIGGEERIEIKNKEIENNRESVCKTQKRFAPPALEEVQEYCKSKGYAWDAESFWLYYESNGWMVGRNKMKSWQSAVANWNKREDSQYRNWQHQRASRSTALIGSTAIPIDPTNIPDDDNW